MLHKIQNTKTIQIVVNEKIEKLAYHFFNFFC
jgi:hypothetical protein